MGCSLEGAIDAREAAIKEGRLSSELWVVAPADSYGWSNMRINSDLQMRLGGLAHNRLGFGTDQILTDKDGRYRVFVDVDCPSFDLSKSENPLLRNKETIARLIEMGAHGDFYLYRVKLDYSRETSAKLASLKSQHPKCTFKIYETEKPISRTYKPNEDYGEFLH